MMLDGRSIRVGSAEAQKEHFVLICSKPAGKLLDVSLSHRRRFSHAEKHDATSFGPRPPSKRARET